MSLPSNTPSSAPNSQVIPVSHLVNRIKLLLEKKDISRFPISGELSNLRPGGNGHLYFNLKDEAASISCVMWAGIRRTLPFTPADGLSVIVHGSLNVYEKRGTISLVVHSMEQTGTGLLYAQLEALKQKLAAEGLFNPAHKKPKPAEIRKIALVTGENTAALQDVLKTIRLRWPMLQVTLFPTLVQGEKAPADIVQALKRADASNQDAVLLVRGGGSFEDLFCFNDERIVRQLYDMKTYTVTGIGHEIDTSLADLASDHKALTPTAAAQWVTEDQREVLQKIRVAQNRMIVAMRRILDMNKARLMMVESSPWLSDPASYARSRRQQLDYLNARLSHSLGHCDQEMQKLLSMRKAEIIRLAGGHLSVQKQRMAVLSARLLAQNPEAKISQSLDRVSFLKSEMTDQMERLLADKKARLDSLQSLLDALSPLNILDKGYAIVEKDNQIVRDASQVSLQDQIRITLAGGGLFARVEEVDPEGFRNEEAEGELEKDESNHDQ